MFEDVLYPKEVTQIMAAVLAGTWTGGNPEEAIDILLGDFYAGLADKRAWAARVAQAVKQLGCLDCVFARLNLECLLDQHEGDRIIIRYDRQRLLPGENHGVGCDCRACIYHLLETQANAGKPALAQPDATKVVEQLPVATDGSATPAVNAAQPITTNQVPTDCAPEAPISYPDDQAALDDLEANFYAKEVEVKHEPPRPSLSPEQKIEVLDILRRTGYTIVEARDKAWERLEKLLKRRSPEQNIIGRLAYLLVFAAFKGLDGHRFLTSIGPKSNLISNKFNI